MCLLGHLKNNTGQATAIVKCSHLTEPQHWKYYRLLKM